MPPGGSIPYGECLGDTRMHAVMGEDRFRRRSNACVKISVCFPARKTIPPLLQFTARRGSEIRVHFGLGHMTKRRHADFFQIADDLWGELLRRRDDLRRLAGPAQGTAVNGIDRKPAESRGRTRGL